LRRCCGQHRLELHLEGSVSSHNIIEGVDSDGRRIFEFEDVDVRTATITPSFGERLIKIVRALKVATANGFAPGDAPVLAAQDPATSAPQS
jgi:hypothetical protein